MNMMRVQQIAQLCDDSGDSGGFGPIIVRLSDFYSWEAPKWAASPKGAISPTWATFVLGRLSGSPLSNTEAP